MLKLKSNIQRRKIIRLIKGAFISSILLTSLVGPAQAKTTEAKGRIDWEKLKIEERKIGMEQKRLQYDALKLQIEGCKQIYESDSKAKTACLKKYLFQLSEIFGHND